MREKNKVRVAFLEMHFRRNPYKESLARALTKIGCEVRKYRIRNEFLLFDLDIQWKPDVLHFHGLELENLNRRMKFLVIAQLLALRIINIKFVWTIHNLYDKSKSEESREKGVSFSGKIIIKMIHAIIVHCESERKTVIERFCLRAERKAFVVPHANYINDYDNSIDRGDARRRLKINEEEFVFLYFGYIDPWKGIPDLIEAFESLKKEKIKLMIVGRAYNICEKEIIHKKIKGQNNICFISEEVPVKQVQVYMNACDCVVLPYKTFTSSGATILAMSFGKVCIAPNKGFFSCVLDDRGSFLYDPTNMKGLLEAMKMAIYKREILIEMGKHNRKIVEQWSGDYIAEKTLKVYRYVLGGTNKLRGKVNV